MEKLKNILSPGKATDDEIMYGSGRSNDPVHSGNTGVLTGEGSHFDNSRDSPSGIGLGSSNVGDAPTTAGPHSTDLANKADPRVDSNMDGSHTAGNTTGAYGSTGRSSMPGAFESDSNSYSTQELDPRLGGPTNISGLGSGTKGTGYETTGQQTGYASQRTTGGLDSHLGRDAAAVGTAGAIGEGIHHHRQNERESLGTSTGTSGTGYGDNTRIENTSSDTSTGPHSSNLLNKLNPRVDSNTSRAVDNTSSGPQYGRDAAAVGGAAAVGEGIHRHRENERDNLGTSGYSGTTSSGVGSAYYSGPTGTAVSEVSGPHTTSTANRLDSATNQSGRPIEDIYQHDPVTGGGGVAADEAHGDNRHHLGRDTAVGAGAVGLAEHEHRKHEHEREAGMGSTTGIGSNTGSYGDNSTYDNTAGTTKGPHKSSLLNKLDPRVESTSGTTDNTGSNHHYGRDAAVGAGGVGLAEHEHRKHEREHERETGVGSTAGLGSNNGAYNEDPAHASTTESTGYHHGRDAAVGAGGVGLVEHEHRKHEREREAGVGNAAVVSNTEAYGNDPKYKDTTGTSSHHYGRDAAVGAGGIGLAEHEHRKHEHEREPGLGSSTGTTAAANSGTGPAPNTAGPHSKDWMNKLDPRVDHNATTANSGIGGASDTTHEGRDAAAGAGLVGAAGYEVEKHHTARNEPGVSGAYDESLLNFHHTGRDASAVGAATALDENEKARLRAARGERDNNYNQGPLEPGYSSTTGETGPYDPGYNPTTTGPTHEQSRDHHLGRDAVGAGAVGGAAYEAGKHHKHDKDLTAAEREEKREREREEKEAKHEHKEEKKHHGLLSFLHRDKNKKYTKEEEDEFDRQESEHHSHTGRDAVVGGAAVGGAAYEAEKHHGHHLTTSTESDTMKPLPVAPGNRGIGTGEGTENALMMDGKHGEGYDVDPTTGTGHPLAAGTDAYQSPGTTIGDKLHGVERNRGVNDGMTGAGYDNTSGTTGTGTHHYGRDVAIGAGGVGLAEHEHRKHEEERVDRVGGNYPKRTGNAGTSSGIGYGTNDPVTNMLGANTQAEQSAGYTAPTAAKHNVLHKDPPSGHPATRAMAGEGTYPQDTTGTGTGSY